MCVRTIRGHVRNSRCRLPFWRVKVSHGTIAVLPTLPVRIVALFEQLTCARCSASTSYQADAMNVKRNVHSPETPSLAPQTAATRPVQGSNRMLIGVIVVSLLSLYGVLGLQSHSVWPKSVGQDLRVETDAALSFSKNVSSCPGRRSSLVSETQR